MAGSTAQSAAGSARAGAGAFDRLARLAAGALHAPQAAIILVVAGRPMVVGACGVPAPDDLGQSELLLVVLEQCARTPQVPVAIPDTRNRGLLSAPLAACAALAVILPEGGVVGVVLVGDRRPRSWSASALAALHDLAALTSDALALHGVPATTAAPRGGPPDPAAGAVAQEVERQWLRAVLDILPIGVFITDRQGRLIVANAATKTIWGANLAMVQGIGEYYAYRGWWAATGQRIAAEDWAMARALLRGETSLNEEVCIETFDGRRKTILNSAVPIYNEQGQLINAVAVNIDITERQQAEERLRLSEARFRSLFNAMPQLVWLNRPDGTVELFNQRWYDFTGASPDELGRWLDWVHPEDQAAAVAVHQRGLSQKSSYRVELRLLRRDGAAIWHEVEVAPLRDEDSAPTLWLSTATDIEARRRQLHSLRFLSEAGALLSASLDFATTLEQVGDLLVPWLADFCVLHTIDLSGRARQLLQRHIDPAKAALLAAFGAEYRYDEGDKLSLARRVLDRLEPVLVPDASQVQIEELVSDPAVRAIYTILAPSSFMVVPLIARGQGHGVLLLGMADSGRHYTPDDLAVARDVAQRVMLALEHARLYYQARDAVREREALLSVASHELKTPLTSLLGYTDMLERRASLGSSIGEREQRYIQTIRTQGTRLNMLLDMLLDAARLESGQLALNCTPVDLQLITVRVLDELAPLLSQRTIDYQGPEVPAIVMGDELRLEQVVRNLIGNAIKYSPEGAPIRVQLTVDCGSACLSVEDKGIGIPAKDLPNIFLRFSRAQNALTGAAKGLGLGLYLVEQIISLHGGKVGVVSTEGQGSSFSIQLPLHAVE